MHFLLDLYPFKVQSKFHIPVKLYKVRKRRYDTKLFTTEISRNLNGKFFL